MSLSVVQVTGRDDDDDAPCEGKPNTFYGKLLKYSANQHDKENPLLRVLSASI